ncbi:MAG TPA: hypothetical protein VF796_11580 [Humisphaera sp.]
MAHSKPAGSKTSKGRTDSTHARREPRGAGVGEKPPRGHRDDTGEAKQQRAGTPKTHPTRNAVASRKSPPGKDDHRMQQTKSPTAAARPKARGTRGR